MIEGFHIPGRPATPEPADLVQLTALLHHKDVLRTGITTTKEGAWALLVVVKPHTSVPIKEIEAKSRNYPVIYQYDPGKLPLARPAYPSRGE